MDALHHNILIIVIYNLNYAKLLVVLQASGYKFNNHHHRHY